MNVDPRSTSSERLIAPHPLPHVSRSALRRVKDPVPVPACCPYCSSRVALVSNAAIYGREYGIWPYAYKCSSSSCDAFVELHPDTDIPLGTLADKALREARKEAKRFFQAFQAQHGFSRGAAYRWLAEELGIPASECHFGWFDANRCGQAAAICLKATR